MRERRPGQPKPAHRGQSGNQYTTKKRIADTLKQAAEPSAPREDDDRIRLHVKIAHSGLCSRRAAEKLILDARVEVNGEIITSLGYKVGPEDVVRVDGQPITEARLLTVMLNKPKGVVTTLRDPQGRPTIVKYLPDYGIQLKPVGRLDMDTEGLLLCTNDGELANRLAHPRYGIEKEYQAIVKGLPDEKTLDKLRKGIWIEGGKTLPAQVSVVHAEAKTQTTSLRIVIHEGRKRQIRLMCEAIDHPVVSLRRLRIGPLFVRGMREGECKLLGQQEVAELKRLVGLEE
jgi:pseudouridine synthase